MIVDDFLCWVETAKTPERTKAANALGRAFVQDRFTTEERRAAEMAIACLLDDPCAAVRLSLAQAFATCANAPRGVILSLCNDQLEIACTVIIQSPLLADNDLVDLAINGNSAKRVMIASRGRVSKSVAAAICEIGKTAEVLQLLQNPGADLSAATLSRIAERLGENAEIRNLLLERNDLPAAARHMLVGKVSQALAASGLVRLTVGAKRADEIVSDAQQNAATIVAGVPQQNEQLSAYVEHLREGGHLTQAFLMRALCAGHAEFFAEVLRNLTGVTARRVRAILAEGRAHAVRALLESAGFHREVSPVYVQCIMLWREEAGSDSSANVALALVDWARQRNELSGPARELVELAERIGFEQMRQSARQYAARVTLQAA